MDYRTIIYPLSNTPKEIIDILSSDYSKLSDILNVPDYVEEVVEEESFLEGLEEYPPKVELDEALKLFRLRAILSEQLLYLESSFNIDVYYVIAYIDSKPYGGVFLFVNGDDLLMQGISKFLEYFEDSDKPKLNSLLDPVIESFCKDLRCKRIIVKPVGNQGRILQIHYKYRETIGFIEYPSNIIKGRTKDKTTYLYKDIKS